MPRIATPVPLLLIDSSLIRTERAGLFGLDHALFQNEAAIEASFAGDDDRIGLLGAFVEGEPLDGGHRPVVTTRIPSGGPIDFGLDFLLDRWNFGRVSDDMHALDGM